MGGLDRRVGTARVSGLTVAPEPPASHFTIADLTIRDVLVILKQAVFWALGFGTLIVFAIGFGALLVWLAVTLLLDVILVFGLDGSLTAVAAFWASLSPTARAAVSVLVAILMFVAVVLLSTGEARANYARWLKRSCLGQRIFVGLMAIAILGVWALKPHVGFMISGAVLGAGLEYRQIRRRRVSRLTTDKMV